MKCIDQFLQICMPVQWIIPVDTCIRFCWSAEASSDPYPHPDVINPFACPKEVRVQRSGIDTIKYHT